MTEEYSLRTPLENDNERSKSTYTDPVIQDIKIVFWYVSAINVIIDYFSSYSSI